MSSKNTLPTAIQLLKLIGGKLPVVSAYFSPQSPSFERLKGILKSPDFFEKNESFVNAKEVVTYIQLLALLALSLDRGILIPSIRRITEKDDGVTIIWEDGLKSTFSWGLYNRDTTDFFKLLTNRVLGIPAQTGHFTPKTARYIYVLLEQYLKTIVQVKFRLQGLMSAPDIGLLTSKTENDDIIFILISGLPPEQLNIFLIYIQQFFPEDLEIPIGPGNKIQICPLFQNSTSDIQFLLDKLLVYYLLYTSPKIPIIREITRVKTRDFLIELLSNQKTKAQTLSSVQDILNQQVTVRESLYQLFLRQLEKLT